MAETKEKLNLKQEKFCRLYATDREFFGNGVETYIEVYKPERKGNWYKTACAAASRLLSNVKICNRINELLSDEGLNDQFVDKQLLFLITQHDDKGAKTKAISEYNKLKKRIESKMELILPQPILQNVLRNDSNTPSGAIN